MHCPRCGNSAVPGAAFCMHCGQPLPQPTQAVPAQMSAGPAPAFPVQPKTNAAMWGIIVGVLALLGTVAGLMASGMLKVGASKNDPAIRAQGSTPPPLLTAQGSDPDPGVKAYGERVVMPDDVRKWLEHLEETERRRVETAKDQIMSLIVLKSSLGPGGVAAAIKGILGDGEEEIPPTRDVEQASADLQRPWRELNEFFNSVQPPEECVPIRNKYDIPLRETGTQIRDIEAILSSAGAGGDPKELITKLNQIFEGHKSVVDKPAAETDAMVQQICNKYDTRKWFAIQGNVGGGSMMSAGGF